ncbi:MAG: thiamine pyrophosphate-binding protein [Pseudomonadota bacterium]
MKTDQQSSSTIWPDQIFRVLKDTGIRQVAYVPDAGHSKLINLCRADKSMRAVSLTTEEEGIAMLAGAWLGGERGVLLMQSSGVGNCINMLGMIQECRLPLLTLVTMRGQWGEFNPWQSPMGQGTPAALENAGVIVQPVDHADEIGETVAAAARLAFSSYRPVAVLISQRVIGFKNWSK